MLAATPTTSLTLRNALLGAPVNGAVLYPVVQYAIPEALEVREYCSKLTDRMRTRDGAFRPRIDALDAATDRDPAVIAFDIVR